MAVKGSGVSGLAAGVAVWDGGADGPVRSTDSGFAAITGYTVPTPSGRPLTYLDIVHETDRETVRARLEAMAPGTLDGIAHRVVTAAGMLADVLLYARRLQDGGFRAVVANVSATQAARMAQVAMMQLMPCGVMELEVHTDPHTGQKTPSVISANDRFFALVGIAREAFDDTLLSLPGSVATPGEREKPMRVGAQACNAPGGQYTIELALAHGEYRLDALCSLVAMPANGNAQRLYCTLEDMTRVRQAEEALQRQTERYYLIASATQERLLDYDLRRDEVTLFQAGGAGRYEDIVIEAFDAGMEARCTLHPADVEPLRAYMAGLAQKQGMDVLDFRSAYFDGQMRWKRVLATSVYDDDGRISRIVGRVMDINEQKAREMDMRTRAERDALTGLYNRGTAQMLIDDFLAHENAYGGEGLHALMMIDLDDFKLVNDWMSHAFGDSVLAQAAQTMRETFRGEDIIARIGGDEFVVLARHVDTVESLRRLADRLCAAMARTVQTPRGDIQLSVSVGIALYPRHGARYAELFHAADMANYHAKSSGKNRYFLYAGDSSIHYRPGRASEVDDIKAVPADRARMEGYVTALLSDAKDRAGAYRVALESVGRMYGMQRGYIIRCDDGGRPQPVGWQWTDEEYSLDGSAFGGEGWQAHACAASTRAAGRSVVMRAREAVPEDTRAHMVAAGVQAAVQYRLIENGRLCGLVGFDYVAGERLPLGEAATEELLRLCRLLAVVALGGAASWRGSHEHVLYSVLDRLPTIVYIVQREDYRILYGNDAFAAKWGPGRVGEACHRALYGRDTPCGVCPMRQLDPDIPGDRAQVETRLPQDGAWLRISAVWAARQGIATPGACFLNAIDITEYK